jgi:hypothetical protein
MLIDEVGQLAAELLLPNSNPDHDRLFDKKHPDRIRVPLVDAGEFRRRLNASGWFDEEVVAGGLITQGKAQSLLSMMLGLGALLELARARRYKALPREFCLAVTPTRVIALATSALAEGNGDVSGDVVVKIKREPVGTWRRAEVRAEPDGRRLRTGYSGGALELGDDARIPVTWDHDHEDTQELIGLLGR